MVYRYFSSLLFRNCPFSHIVFTFLSACPNHRHLLFWNCLSNGPTFNVAMFSPISNLLKNYLVPEDLLVERDLQGRVPAAVQVQVSSVVLLPQSWQVLQRLLHHDGHWLHLDPAWALLELGAQPRTAEDLRGAHIAGGGGPGLRPGEPYCLNYAEMKIRVVMTMPTETRTNMSFLMDWGQCT